MTKYRKKLIEVALPLEAINREAAREKSIRHGHPSTLHLWWARRPLAACRAVLFASLVDDPDSDPRFDSYADEEREHAVGERRAELFELIEELVKWENSNNTKIINRARAEIAASVASGKIELSELDKDTIIYAPQDSKLKEGDRHPDGPLAEDGATAYRVLLRQSKPEVINHFLAHYAPPVLDPFAGGGSIPLEAQRLGLRAHASDLNPVAVLINKTLIEIPPRFSNRPPVYPNAERRTGWSGAQGLAEDVRRYGKWMRDEAEIRIGHLYPKVRITKEMATDRPDLQDYVGQGLTVIAWLWCRTVKCPNPGCGHRMPMLRSFWLSKKKGKEAFADPVVDSRRGNVRFKIRFDGSPRDETSNRNMARCLFCANEMKKPQLREIAREHGMAEIPVALVAEATRGRIYLEAQDASIPACKPPDAREIEQPITDDKRWFSPPQYGLPTFRDLFTPRQLTALITFSDLVGEARAKLLDDARAAEAFRDHPDPDQPFDKGGAGPHAYADAVATILGLVVSRTANSLSTLSIWSTARGQSINAFGRQALPMTWDFPEVNPFAGAAGDFAESTINVARTLEGLPAVGHCVVSQEDARVSNTRGIIATDPPYYDNIGYADLSDFFYVWLRRSLREVLPDLLSTVLTPKGDELIASPYRHHGSKAKAATFFEKGLGCAIGQWRTNAYSDYPTTVFYAFKQAETDREGTASTGWETFLAGVIAHGFTINATWPMRTERDQGLKTGTNVLASSIVLACVPRAAEAAMATRREFAEALRAELPNAIRNMQSGNIAPVDLSQASIGPGMAVFSRYNKVVNADGTPMSVRQALQLINHVLDEALTEQESDFDADTRLALDVEIMQHVQELQGPVEVAASADGVVVFGQPFQADLEIDRSGHGRDVLHDSARRGVAKDGQ